MFSVWEEEQPEGIHQKRPEMFKNDCAEEKSVIVKGFMDGDFELTCEFDQRPEQRQEW